MMEVTFFAVGKTRICGNLDTEGDECVSDNQQMASKMRQANVMFIINLYER
jgi:hypothetical protein